MRKGTIYAVVALVVALAGAGLVANKLWHNTLTAEASKTEAALKTAAQFKLIAEAEAANGKIQRREALVAQEKAARAEARYAALADHADSIAAWAPDTCRPYIAAQVDARDELQHALDAQKQATAKLRSAAASDSIAIASLLVGIGTATTAAQDLVDATHRSFFLRILPKPGISVTAGITPRGKFDVVGGVSLGWTF